MQIKCQKLEILPSVAIDIKDMKDKIQYLYNHLTIDEICGFYVMNTLCCLLDISNSHRDVSLTETEYLIDNLDNHKEYLCEICQFNNYVNNYILYDKKDITNIYDIDSITKQQFFELSFEYIKSEIHDLLYTNNLKLQGLI